MKSITHSLNHVDAIRECKINKKIHYFVDMVPVITLYCSSFQFYAITKFRITP